MIKTLTVCRNPCSSMTTIETKRCKVDHIACTMNMKLMRLLMWPITWYVVTMWRQEESLYSAPIVARLVLFYSSIHSPPLTDVKNIMGLSNGMSTESRELIFVEGEPENLEKNPRSTGVKRTNKQLYCMTMSQTWLKPRSFWWEAGTLTATPLVLPRCLINLKGDQF